MSGEERQAAVWCLRVAARLDTEHRKTYPEVEELLNSACDLSPESMQEKMRTNKTIHLAGNHSTSYFRDCSNPSESSVSKKCHWLLSVATNHWSFCVSLCLLSLSSLSPFFLPFSSSLLSLPFYSSPFPFFSPKWIGLDNCHGVTLKWSPQTLAWEACFWTGG